MIELDRQMRRPRKKEQKKRYVAWFPRHVAKAFIHLFSAVQATGCAGYESSACSAPTTWPGHPGPWRRSPTEVAPWRRSPIKELPSINGTLCFSTIFVIKLLGGLTVHFISKSFLRRDAPHLQPLCEQRASETDIVGATPPKHPSIPHLAVFPFCLLYTSDAADE